MRWYQHRVGSVARGVAAGLGERRAREEVRERDCRVNAWIESWRRETSARSCSTSAAICGVPTADTDGIATSVTLSARSARSASSSRVEVVLVDARTMRTLAGRHWRNSSLRNVPSAAPTRSPSNCCIRRSSWVGFLSPSSSVLRSCCSFLCSEAAVRLTSCSLLSKSSSSSEQLVYGVCTGVWCVSRRMQDEIADLCSELWGEGRYNVIKHRFLGCDPVSSKLCFHLCKPHFRIGWPKWRQLDVDSCYGWRRVCFLHSHVRLTSGSPMLRFTI